MFGLSRKIEPALAPIETSRPHLDETALVAAIEALTAGDYAVSAASGDALSKALARLTEKLRDRASSDLDRIVGANVQIGETSVAVAKILESSRSIDARTQGMAAAVTEMVASVSQVANSTDAVAGAMREANAQVAQGRGDTLEAHRAMGAIADAVETAAAKIEALAEASEKIGAIVKAIEAIASQTNLLALNATIEAARAGDAGKGFAVVAGEVKSLSRQTAQATEDIRQRIGAFRGEIAGIVAAMREGSAAAVEGRRMMDKLGVAMETVGRHAEDVSGRMSEIANVIEGQSAAAKEIAEGVSAIATSTKEGVELVTALSGAMDASQKFTLEAQASLAELEFPAKIVRLAKADHVLWKKRLADMAVGRTKLRAEELADHRSCRLGKWYYGEGAATCAHLDAFRALEAPHERVHRHGIQAARLFADGKHAEALAEIAKVETASADVLARLDELRAGQKA